MSPKVGPLKGGIRGHHGVVSFAWGPSPLLGTEEEVCRK